jgi:hypothetical protein
MLQNISEPQLLEFYYCGMRTGYSQRQLKKQAVEGKTTVYNCEYCPSFHEIPVEDNVKETAKSEYAKIIHRFSRTETINIVVADTPTKYEPSDLTDSIIIRGIN